MQKFKAKSETGLQLLKTSVIMRTSTGLGKILEGISSFQPERV
jgi:hypothetical protein